MQADYSMALTLHTSALLYKIRLVSIGLTTLQDDIAPVLNRVILSSPTTNRGRF
jgi:hypothetical protein